MLAVQSPHHGTRGIGRYSANLVASLLARDDDHDYLLYVHDGLPTERVPDASRAEVRTLRPRWELGEVMSPYMDRFARTNPDGLDVLVVLSPFEKWAAYTPPVRTPDGPRIVAVVYDLIPFLFQNEMRIDAELMRHYHVLETITRYDALLAISGATRRDFLSVLRLAPERVVNISGASDPSFFVPDRSTPVPEPVRRDLAELGIDRPFVLNVGGLDIRKNTWKLIDAFADLPSRLRESHQLVLTFAVDDWGREAVQEHLRKRGVEGSVLLTGAVSDVTLLRLYQRCEVFAMPSLYEGFGLPLLEAMHCGAAVLAGNNSSQVEVVGDAGLLAEVDDIYDIAAKLASVLDDPGLLGSLRARASERASTFTWDKTAAATAGAISGVMSRPRPTNRVRFDRGHTRKPTIAFFSPLPPRKSGISDYSTFLLDELRKTYRIDLFHDAGYLPEPALRSSEFMSCDYRVFERIAASKDYHAIVYQMGNSWYHGYMYPILLRHRGLVTLHDFSLAGFHLHYGHSRGLGKSFIAEELRRMYPEDAELIEEVLPSWPESWEEIVRDCTRRGWYLNRRVLDAAACMVVHSPWCEAQVRASSPEYSDRVIVIPHGIHPRRTTDAERAAIRGRYNLPGDALVVASFGFIHPDKMSPQALDAFRTIAHEDPRALFVFVGEEADGGEVRRHSLALGLKDRVRFLGRQPAGAFAELISVTDVGVNLRLPPTNGETSGALLNLLAAGVPAVVTDVATFSDYPASVVRKVRWETEGPDGLLRAMHGLCTDRLAREALGQSAWSYVDDHHEWSRVARLYVDAIERCHEAQAAARAAAHTGRPGPVAAADTLR
jgi:glycosyltransferase involved in cell wall biosynthesis